MSLTPGMRPTLPAERVLEYVGRFSRATVAVLGDVMLDRYFWGDAERISPEAPVPVVHVTRRSKRLGGAANVAANLRALGLSTELISVRGADREGRELARMLGRREIGTAALVEARGRTTTEKVRIIARSQQVLRADFETDEPLAGAVADAVYDNVARLADTADALVVSDYGKGVVVQDRLAGAIAAWRDRGKPVLVDPHIPHFAWYRGVTLITPNAREAHAAAGIDYRRGNDPAALAFDVLKRMGLDALLVTRGEDGMSLYYRESQQVHIPTVAKQVFDVTGAGDTVIGVLAAGLATGVDMLDAVVMSNQAAGEVIKEVGTSTLSAAELVAAFR
ncbi:MAG: D-glycero-beta-D-manno-heptose-7-phosphate kinase [Candidatus Krumholzibacteria bacterium]|nr:D-glycero-beta-D-manno-heptose-7-phosphate kinase [Candidatus Krumholzibacteria bacterium]MDH4338291.1 D-glycero-beta-D-manno-heptose-7-phosphate kinase [Candidatus Krumholzibacteria bacterium]MDH5268924.1 D-glycero-beta-D-manno-heptose-7-phosphate kinase [Candidatus Krumholzibacteria bacterium]MDH5628496.1 D-glycero-beta-D-manno-heptose-7-phosphate kinase [Candidatus Krumholzibacteria bacterium]